MTDDIPDWATDMPSTSTVNDVPDWAQESAQSRPAEKNTSNVKQNQHVLDAIPGVGALQASADKIADTATFGLGKYAAGAGAAAANMVKAPFTGDLSPGAAYEKGRNEYEQQLESDSAKHPIASDVGNVVGFMGSFGQASPKMAQTVAPIRDAVANTTLGKGISARTGDQLEEATQAIKNNSSGKYKQYREAGVVLTPEAGVQAVDDIKNSLGRISPRRQGDTLSVLEDLETRAKEGNLGLEDLDEFRQDFRDVHNDHTDFTGRTKSDGYKATQAIDALDTFVEKLKPQHIVDPSLLDVSRDSVGAVDALTEGRQRWTQYKKFDAVANVVKQADGDPNKLKAGLTRFLNKPKNTAGWPQNEIAALQNAARNTTGEKLLKTVGKFGIDLGSSLSPGNTALPALTGFTGLGTGASHGIPMVAAGTAARQGQKWLARGKAEQLLQTLEENANNPLMEKATGGAINMKRGGGVFKRPAKYSMLEKRT